jgi:O-antigen ligase
MKILHGNPWLSSWRFRPLAQSDVAFPILTGVIAAVLGGVTLFLGPYVLPLVIGLFFVLPWLVQSPFRLFIWLLITWQAVSIYVESPLPGISYERSMAALIVGLLLLEALVLKRRALPAVGFFVVAYVATQFISRFYVVLLEGVGAFEVTDLLKVVLLPVLMYWLTLTLVVSRRHLQWLLYGLILTSMLIGLSGLFEWVRGSPQSPFPVTAYNAEGATRYMDVPRGRAAGIFGNPAIFGAMMGIGMLATLACMQHTRRRFWLWPALVLLSAGAFLSFTRSAWLSVLLTLFIAQFFLFGLWKRTLPIFWAGALVLVLLAGALADNQVVRDRLLDGENATGRVDRALFAFEVFLEKPLLGWGPGQLDELTARRFPASGFSSSHNTFMTMLVDGGLLVFGVYLALLTYVAAQLVRVYRVAPPGIERSALVVAGGGLLIYLLSGMAVELRHFSFFVALFWVFVGMVELLRRVYLTRGPEAERAREAWLKP